MKNERTWHTDDSPTPGGMPDLVYTSDDGYRIEVGLDRTGAADVYYADLYTVDGRGLWELVLNDFATKGERDRYLVALRRDPEAAAMEAAL